MISRFLREIKTNMMKHMVGEFSL